MNNFETEYLKLLKRQVEEEISYLVRNGHDNTPITLPCMFCAPAPRNTYVCRRLTELRQFQSQIAVRGGRDIPKQRKTIGYDHSAISDAVNYQAPPIRYEPSRLHHEDEPVLLNSSMDLPLIVIK